MNDYVKSERAGAQSRNIATIHVRSSGFIDGTSANLREGMMQSRLWIGGVLLVLSLSTQAATAGPQEDVAAAGQKWATVFAENNPDAMLPLYGKDAVLWGTLSPTIRSDPAAVKAYFVGAFQALPKATVKFGDQLIRVYGNTAVNSGYYTFSYTKDGETKSIPALQLHLCEGRQRLENRRPSLLGGASPAQVSAEVSAEVSADRRRVPPAPDKTADASR
jgi:hypothetical protein